MKIHEQVLIAARRLCAKPGWTFSPVEVVRALPHLNERTVRTHIVSRCCVNAPCHHESRWPYFIRLGWGLYEIQKEYRGDSRDASPAEVSLQVSEPSAVYELNPATLRPTIHAVVAESEGLYVAECLEVAIVTQGTSLDEILNNLREGLDLYLSGEDYTLLGLAPAPEMVIRVE